MRAGVMGFSKLSLGTLGLLASITLVSAEETRLPTIPAPSEALATAQSSVETAWSAAPLGFSKALFTDGPAAGFGQFSPRADTVFSSDETINVYAEPVAFGIAAEGETYSYSLSASFRLLNTTGQVLAENADFATFAHETRSARRELSTSMSFQFSGLPSGDYVLEIDMKDGIGNKDGVIALPFSVKAAKAQ